MTIKDIARLAGVSPSTVSRILNDPTNSFARPDTRNRVWQIVEQYNYVPNSDAKNLKMGRGLLSEFSLACLISHTRNEDENPFFSQLTRSIEQAAVQNGFSIPYYFSNLSLASPDFVAHLQSLKLNGIVFVGRFQNQRFTELMKKQFRNLIYVGLTPMDIAVDQVICDGYAAATAAIEHLIRCGHRSIAYIGASRYERRYQAYKQVLHDHGLPAAPSLVSFCEYDGLSGYQAAQDLLSRNPSLPTAIFCANDNTAIMVIRCLENNGLRVPGDISIISVDDIDAAKMLSPALTTVHVPKEEMGQVAIETLESRLHHRRTIPLKIELPYKLIIRDTVAAVQPPR